MSTENTTSNSFLYRIYAIISAFWIFVSRPFISAVSGLSAVCKRSSTMELPLSSPTIHQMTFTGDSMCPQTTGYPRISRIGRQRCTYRNDSTTSRNAESTNNCVSDDLPPEEWVEEISESKSSPYMTSSSTIDNTTISASISLESHSVYSSPPSSLIFRTPIITITGPGEACSEGDDLGNESFSEDALDEEQPVGATVDVEETDDHLATDTETPPLYPPSLGNLAIRRRFHGAPVLTSFPPLKVICSPSMPSWSPHSRQSSGYVSIRRPKTALLSPDMTHEDYMDIDISIDDTQYEASTADTLMDHSSIYTPNKNVDSNTEQYFIDDDAFSNAYTPTAPIMTTIYEHEESDDKSSDYMRRSLFRANKSPAEQSEISTIQAEPSKDDRKKLIIEGDEYLSPNAADSIHDSPKTLSSICRNPYASRSLVRRALSGIEGDLAVFADLITQIDRPDDDKEFGDRRFSFPYYPTGHNYMDYTKAVKSKSQVSDSKSDDKVAPSVETFRVLSSSGSHQHEARCSSLSPADIKLDSGELSAVDLRAGFPLDDGLRESLVDFSTRIDVNPRPMPKDTKKEAKPHPGTPGIAENSDCLIEAVNKDFPFSSYDRDTTDLVLERRLAVRSWLDLVNDSNADPAVTQPESLELGYPESPHGESASGRLDIPSGDDCTRPFGSKEDQKYTTGHNKRSVKQRPLKHSNSRHAPNRSLDFMSARDRVISLERYRESLVFSGRKFLTTELHRESVLRPLMLPMCLAVRDSMGGINRCVESTSVTAADTESCDGHVQSSAENGQQRTLHMLDAVLGQLAEALNLPIIVDTSPSDNIDYLSSPHHSNCDLKENQGDISTDSTISWGIAL